MNPIFLVVPLLAGALTAFVLDQSLKRARLPLDQPNERSLHVTPIPRSGGFVLVPVTLLGWLALDSGLPWEIWVSCAVLFLVSAFDDVRGLPVALRFLCHLAAAALVAVGVAEPEWHVLGLVVAILGMGWMINLYNFMDGADGLAGGMALIGFGTYGIAAWVAGDFGMTTAAWTVSGAAAGFLALNFPPARVFLGDAGSVPLGLLAGALGYLGWTRGLWPAWFPLVVFSPFIVDATVTLARRALRGEKIWQAHREHYYQRLVLVGWGHRRTALAEYGLMSGCALLALLGLTSAPAIQWALLLACTLAYVCVMALVDRAWRRHTEESECLGR